MKDLQEDNLFGSMRERLGRYEETPSEELWNKIASRKRERVWPVFLEPIGIVAVGLVLLLSDSNVEVTKQNVSSKEIISRKEIIAEKAVAIVIPDHSIQLQSVQLQSVQQNEIVQLQQSQTSSQQPETKSDSIEAVSPTIIKKDSSVAIEVVPPYKKPKSRFQIFISVTPSLSFQKMSPSANDRVIVQGFESRSPMSVKRFGFGIDAGFQKDINKFLGFYGGISFYRQHQELTYLYYNSEAEVNRVGDSWTFEILRSQQTRTFDYTMTNLGVRSGLLVTVKGEKLKHKFGAGLVYTQGFAKGPGSYNNSRSSYLAYQLSYRNELKINEHISWFIEPVFTYSFLSKEKLEEPFKLKPYRAGISTGLLYRF